MCDYINHAEMRRQALAEMIQVSEEAGLYDTEPTADDVEAAVKRVRKLHSSMTHIYGKVACKECGQKYPCQTINALDGEQ